MSEAPSEAPAPLDPTAPPGLTAKGERTRARILDAALELFREQGFEGTTMREVADRAGVSVGNAYYYFAGKEHLVQGFYARTDVEHRAACRELLARERGFRERLEGVVLAKVETAEPYHGFAALLFKTAADPRSPLNPFSAESAPVRDEAVALMREVLEGSDAKVPADLREDLPDLLWLYLMGVVLFWLHDESPGRRRTRRLTEHTAGLVATLLKLSSLPLMGPLRRKVRDLLASLRPEPGEGSAEGPSEGGDAAPLPDPDGPAPDPSGARPGG